MYNQGQQNGLNEKNSLFELVENDFFVNLIGDQPHSGIPRTSSNPQFFNQSFNQYPLGNLGPNYGNYGDKQMQMEGNFVFGLPDQNGQLMMNFDPNMKEEFIAQNQHLDSSEFGFIKDDNHQSKQKAKSKKRHYSPSKVYNQLQSVQDESGLLKKNTELFTYKNNLKNTYINKISSLISTEPQKQSAKSNRSSAKQMKNQKNGQQPSSDEVEDIKDPINQSNIGNEDDNTNAKLLRNRECARNSRKRKKIYIELLENKVKTLSDELDKTKKILKTSTSYLSKMSQNQQLQGFFLGRQQLFEKLEKAIQNESDATELNLLLDSMRFRVGGGGKERVNAGNYFFNQILDLCFPIHVRYLLWSSSQNKDIFFQQENEQQLSEDHWASWSKELISQLNINDSQKMSILKQKRKLIQEKQKIEELIHKFSDIKDQIYQRTSQVENFVDELRNILSPAQVAKFLTGLEQNKYRKEMCISKIWDVFDNGSDYDFDIKEESNKEEPQKKIHI